MPFTQDGDTFYLAISTQDMAGGLCAPMSSMAQTCQLTVPCGRNAACVAGQGVHVEAFGRIVGGAGAASQMLLTSIDQNDQPPTVFGSLPPGYTADSIVPDVSHPFRLFTDLNRSTRTSTGSVRVRVNYTTGVKVYEDTDGWVFHR